MNSASAVTAREAAPASALAGEPMRDEHAAPRSAFLQRFRLFPLLLTLGLYAFVFVPPVKGNSRLQWTFIGVASVMLAWQALLWLMARRRGGTLMVEYFPVRSHWVQACVQFSIVLWWGWHWRNVYTEMPLFLAQTMYLYALDAMLSWSRGRTWRLGFGPLPIVISTNLLLWFKHDWYVFQFVMLTLGALGKQFITWRREGRTTHIFNPSAFGQSLVALVLIATGTTYDYTWGREIASTFEAPHILIVIFLGGLVVQYLFHVTLMTLAAVSTLCLLNVVYTQVTGLYFFVNINVAAPIFLGVHLLMTDPATSPRTNLGRVIFGSLYGIGYFALFRIFDVMEIPLFWDKLLPVPVLNLCVPLLDRAMRAGALGRLNRRWEDALSPARLNFVHMGLWAGVFVTMIATGFIEAPHPGNSITFWKQAYVDGRHHAGHSLVMVAGAQAEGGRSGAAFNELGLICMEGDIVQQNRARAARYFGDASRLGDLHGSANVAIQFLFLHERRSDDDVARALDHLEVECDRQADWGVCFLVGNAYETGRGRPWDKTRAIELYQRCGWNNLYACKGLARIALSGTVYDLTAVAPVLQSAAASGDAESCWYLAYMHLSGNGVPQEIGRARALMQRACDLGARKACEAIQQSQLPAYDNPVMVVPGWSTAFPVARTQQQT